MLHSVWVVKPNLSGANLSHSVLLWWSSKVKQLWQCYRIARIGIFILGMCLLHDSERSIPELRTVLLILMAFYRFNESMEVILERHENVVEKMAEGIIQLREQHGINITSERNIQYFLDRLYLSRISIRMLQYQHCLLLFSCFCRFFRLLLSY